MPDQLSFIACTDSYEHLTCKMLAIMTWVSKLKTKTKVQFLKQCHTLFILPLFICSRIFSALSYYSRVCGWKVNNTRGLSCINDVTHLGGGGICQKVTLLHKPLK